MRRGVATRPLYVTAAGLSLEKAASLVTPWPVHTGYLTHSAASTAYPEVATKRRLPVSRRAAELVL